jgi:hypothetical protein
MSHCYVTACLLLLAKYKEAANSYIALLLLLSPCAAVLLGFTMHVACITKRFPGVGVQSAVP